MTKITHDVVIYENVGYELLSPVKLIKPADLGLLTTSRGSTDNPAGYLCTYAIATDRLFLESLSCATGQPKGWVQQIKFMFGKYPPKINGIEAIEIDKDEVRYEQLSHQLNYTGALVVGITDYKLVDQIDRDDPSSYVELLLFALNDGKLLSLERMQGKLEMPRLPRFTRLQ